MPDGPVLRCGSCGYSYLTPVLDLGEQPLPQAVPGRDTSKRYPLRLVECLWCTLVQLDYIVPQSQVFPADYPYVTGNTKALRDHFAEQARYVADLLPLDGLAVDIGGNDGTMLLELRELVDTDARLLLIEPTDQGKKCTAKGIPVWPNYFTAEVGRRIRERHGPAAVITASNVFGHVPDPHDFLDGVTELLAEDGTFIIDNQDWQNVVNDLQIDTIYHEHLRYYSPASLSWLLARHGLLVVSLTRLEMHGGSFRAIVRRQKPDLQGRTAQLVNQLLNLMDEAVQAGPIYAVTAPSRATPLVNYAGLGKYLTCACEIAACEKIGACIPGTDVPIVDEAVLFADQPPHALLLAWDIADSLIPVLRRKGYKGKIILPLPEPRITDG
jgi:hypothetical protein